MSSLIVTCMNKASLWLSEAKLNPLLVQVFLNTRNGPSLRNTLNPKLNLKLLGLEMLVPHTKQMFVRDRSQGLDSKMHLRKLWSVSIDCHW